MKTLKYKQGKNYRFWLNKSNFKGRLKFVKSKKTNYGFIVNLFTNYITLYTKKIYLYKNGFVKIVTIVDQNYRAKYQYTTYYNKIGNEIIVSDNSTRKELSIFKQLQTA